MYRQTHPQLKALYLAASKCDFNILNCFGKIFAQAFDIHLAFSSKLLNAWMGENSGNISKQPSSIHFFKFTFLTYQNK